MATLPLSISRQAARFIKTLPPKQYKQVVSTILALANDPQPHGGDNTSILRDACNTNSPQPISNVSQPPTKQLFVFYTIFKIILSLISIYYKNFQNFGIQRLKTCACEGCGSWVVDYCIQTTCTIMPVLQNSNIFHRYQCFVSRV